MISKCVFSTSEMGARKRYEAFRESIGVVFDVSRPMKKDEEFSARIESFLLGEILFVDCMTSSQTFHRSEKMISGDGVDHYLIQFFDYGYTRRKGGQEEAIGGRGNLLVIDSSQPWKAVNSDFRNLTLVIPRRLLSDLLVHEGDHHGRIIDSRNPFCDFLLSYFLNFRGALEKMSIKEASEISQISLHLLSSALNVASEGSALPHSEGKVRQYVLKGRIKQFLELHLHDPYLTPRRVAERFRISKKELQRLFEPEGGLSRHIHARRMEMAMKRLWAVRFKTELISEVAASIGYKNLSAFYRDFEKRFNVMPQEMKDNQSFDKGFASGEDHRLWEKWFIAL